jgi:hypothetical protein
MNTPGSMVGTVLNGFSGRSVLSINGFLLSGVGSAGKPLDGV